MEIQAWAQRWLDWADRTQRTQPLREAMLKNNQILFGSLMPEAMVGMKARSRQTTLSLERRIAEFPKNLLEAEARMADELAAARRKTQALRLWLEEVS